jgi:alpha-tubulin suppressor-like RCC1 family protein
VESVGYESGGDDGGGDGGPADGDGAATWGSTLAVGTEHACALAAGTVYCWGLDDVGQIGSPTTETCVDAADASVACSRRPVAVPLDASVVAVAAAAFHTCARTVEGAAYCWGLGKFLGAGFGDEVPRGPTPVHLAPDVQAIVLGAEMTYAIHGGGQLVGWGSDYLCQLVDRANGTGFSSTPLSLLPSVDWAASGGAAHSACAHTTDGKTLCWGSDQGHQLPLASYDAGRCGAGPPSVSSPTPVDLGAPILAMSLSPSQGCAALQGGLVTCFGDGVIFGPGAAVGTGPFMIPNVADAVGVGVGDDNFACARTKNGAAICWGGSGNGDTGRGTNAQNLAPDSVLDSNFAPLAGVEELATGASFACVRLADGGVSCWGTNYTGQLGDGTSTPHNVAQPVALPP